MEINDQVLEIEGVSGISLYPSGKCIITLTSAQFANDILALKDKITQLNEEIDHLEKRTKKDKEYTDAKIADLEKKLLTDRFDGITMNMESMFEAIAERKNF